MPLFSIGRICEARFLPILRARRTLKFQSRLFPRHWIPMRRGSSLARTEIYDGSECPLCHHELDESFFIPPRDVDTSSSPRRTVGLQALPTTETWKKMTFYKRQLPLDVCIAFSSEEGRAVFREALTDGTVESFFKVISLDGRCCI